MPEGLSGQAPLTSTGAFWQFMSVTVTDLSGLNFSLIRPPCSPQTVDDRLGLESSVLLDLVLRPSGSGLLWNHEVETVGRADNNAADEDAGLDVWPSTVS